MSESPLIRPVAVVGVPFDAYSSFLRGPALAPARIRETLYCASGNWSTETGIDLLASDRWEDQGNFDIAVEDEPLRRIQEAAAGVLAEGKRLVALGGDHSISLPLVAAHAAAFGPPAVLHLDAHGDLYDSLDGNPLSHACPFARIMEAGHASGLVQVGLRALTKHQRDQAARFGVHTLEMRHTSPEAVSRQLRESLPKTAWSAGVYLSLDLDVLDPAFAPGVSHHEPGGMTTRELLTIIQDLPVPLLGVDIVEFNPIRDSTGTTAMVAAKMLKEILAKMLQPGG
ncbi:MAG: agmatinase [Spirochaetaceae bacterium]